MQVLARKDIRCNNFTTPCTQSGLKGCRVKTLIFINISLAFLVFVHRYSQARLANMLEMMFIQLLIQDEGLQGILYSITVLDVTIVKTFNNLCDLKTLKQSMCFFTVYSLLTCPCNEFTIVFMYCIQIIHKRKKTQLAFTCCEKTVDTPNWSKIN